MSKQISTVKGPTSIIVYNCLHGLNSAQVQGEPEVLDKPSFLSKLIERIVAARLRVHMSQHCLNDPHRSGYRPNHSTETVLLEISDQILTSLDKSEEVLLVLLDLSAAFDTVDHHILLDRLQECVGLQGQALKWFSSYLKDRFFSVCVDGNTSSRVPL